MMTDKQIGRTRRTVLLRALSLLGFSLAPLRRALAVGERPAAPGIYRAEGEVRVNGVAAQPGRLVLAGDVIETGARSLAIFVAGRDAYLLRAETRLEIAGRELFIDTLRIVTGKVLSVLGPGARRIETRTATIGIRGTGIYVEAEPERTYACTCYGVADLQSRDMPEILETVTTTHHEQPRYIYGKSMPAIRMIEGAPVINHTDDELIMLEALVGRRPPFVTEQGPRY